MKYIFEDIIQTQEIFITIEKHFDDEEEKEHMFNLVKNTFHHQLMDVVMDEITHDQKVIFLVEIEDETKHEGLLERLKEWVIDLDEKLHLRAKEAESEMLYLIELDS